MELELRIRENKWVVFFISSGAYFILEKIFNLATNFLKNFVTLKFIALNLVDWIFIIIFLIGIGILIYDKVIMRNRIKKETTVDIVRRRELPQLSVLFKDAKELHMVGITLQELQQATNTIRDVLSKDGKVRVLLCDPAPTNMLVPEIDKVVKSQETAKKITSTLVTLQTIRNDSSLSEKQRMELVVRTHKLIPTHTLLIMNPDSDSAVMQVEPYPYGIEAENRRVFPVFKKKHKEVFEMYWRSYENMWDTATS